MRTRRSPRNQERLYRSIGEELQRAAEKAVPRCGCPVNAPEADPKRWPCPCGEHCKAERGNPLNDRPENVRWATYSENALNNDGLRLALLYERRREMVDDLVAGRVGCKPDKSFSRNGAERAVENFLESMRYVYEQTGRLP